MRITRILDLSRPLDEDTVVFPGDPQPRLTAACTIAEDGYNVLALHLGSQTGSHVDAPYHFRADGARIDELPLERFVGPGVLLDVQGHGPREPITADELPRDRLRPGVIALLHTGWARHYGAESYFDHPYLHTTACELLLESGVRTVLIDAPSIDETPDERHPGDGFPAHHLFAAADGVIGENLCDLDRIDWPDPLISVLPIRLAGADGAPVRAVAMQIT